MLYSSNGQKSYVLFIDISNQNWDDTDKMSFISKAGKIANA